jgi:hypothetical protein
MGMSILRRSSPPASPTLNPFPLPRLNHLSPQMPPRWVRILATTFSDLYRSARCTQPEAVMLSFLLIKRRTTSRSISSVAFHSADSASIAFSIRAQYTGLVSGNTPTKSAFLPAGPSLLREKFANSGFATDGTVRYAGHSFDIDGSRVLNANTEELTERTFTEAKELGVHARSSGNLCGDLY